MPHYKLALLGFGNVGRALAQLLLRKRTELNERYDITFSVTGIATGRHGIAINPNGIDLEGALDLFRTGRTLDLLSKRKVTNSLDFIQECGADVLFENSPVNYETGQPAIDHVRAALEQGMHVATANKGTVVHAYHELKALAAEKGKRFFFESTVMDGAPIFSLFRGALPGAQLKAFRAVLNSTTNLILTRMENGDTFDGAVRYAQQIGIAETDPSGDIDGWDAAIKVAALATVLMDTPLKPQQVERTGIREITPAHIAAAKAEGKRYKLICTAEKDGDTVRGRVAPELVSLASPFASVEGTTSIIEFQTDVLGNLTLIETDPGPHTTAYGLLADFLNAVR
ncbi:MAG: homoserine dehydrogenase [Anaerolineales bacterium]|nr:homoserine dehydrogenase [Anaerolineales bacterium]MCX7755226.1 homoserine dehydrogenase [Anaerolineales bacterium]MDW8277499.1 homoserine dehydrogenase [Anaerolineales bacterium]